MKRQYFLLSLALWAVAYATAFSPQLYVAKAHHRHGHQVFRLSSKALRLTVSSGGASSSPVTSSDKSPKKDNDKRVRDNVFSAEARQLLGIKDAASQTEKWKIRIQLCKPITWVPLSLVTLCGAAASGNYHCIWNPFVETDKSTLLLGIEDALKGLMAMILAGPFSEGFAQTINDWFDREIDAINEPHRPIPSGAISAQEVFQQLWFLFLGGMSLAACLDKWSMNDFPTVSTIALFGYFVSYIYSAPPLKLKQNGWLGALAIGTCYIALPWWCGAATFGNLEMPVDWSLPLFWSMSGIGAAIVNDFKSIEGDDAFGLKSIPILVGEDTAKYLAAAVPDLVQVTVATYLNMIGETVPSMAILALILPQMYFQFSLLFPDPLGNDVKYMTYSQPFMFFSVLVTALAISHHNS